MKDLEFSAVLKQSIDPQNGLPDNAGWGGIVFRGQRLNSDPIPLLNAYVVAFVREEQQERFVLYRLEEHPADKSILPDDLPGTVSEMAGIDVDNFQFDQWYTVRVEVTDDNITAYYWVGADDSGTENGKIDMDPPDPQPLRRGFLGAIHLEEKADVFAPRTSEMKWDILAIGDLYDPESIIDFGDQSAGLFPNELGTAIHYGDYEVTEDLNASSGDRVLEYMQEAQEGAGVNVFVWHERAKENTGMLEAGKRYMLKIIVADSDDPWYDSICLIEKGGVKIEPYFPK